MTALANAKMAAEMKEERIAKVEEEQFNECGVSKIQKLQRPNIGMNGMPKMGASAIYTNLRRSNQAQNAKTPKRHMLAYIKPRCWF